MIRSSLTVLQGTAAAQALGLLMLPVIGRLFSPDAFGDFQLFQSALSLALPFAALRLEYALLRVRRDRTVGYVLALCLLLNVAVALVAAVLLWLAGPTLPEVHRQALWASGLFPVAILVAGALQTTSYLPVRFKRFRLIAGSKLLQTGTFLGGAVAVGMSGWPTGTALVLSDLLGRGAAAALLFVAWLRGESPRRLTRFLRVMGAILSRYRDDPRFAAPSSFVSALAAALPVFALTTLFSPASAGQFGMAWRIALMPIAMVTLAVSQVVNAEVSGLLRHRRRGAWARIRKVTAAMALLAIAPVGVAAAFGEVLVPLVLGPEWVEAGRMVEVMSPLLLLSFIMGPSSTLMVVLGRQSVHFAWEIVRAVLLVGVFLLTGPLGWSPIGAVGAYSLVMAGMSAVYLLLVRWIVRGSEPPASGPLQGV